jgi:hypothetical protein
VAAGNRQLNHIGHKSHQATHRPRSVAPATGWPTVVLVSGVIYGLIVCVWAAFLVPRALRRYDEASRARSVERFSSAMRVLGRRTEVESRREVGADGADPTAPHVSLSNDSQLIVEPAPEPRSRPNPAAARAAAERRQLVVFTLFIATLAVGSLAGFGVVPPWAVGVPVLLIAMFLYTCRRRVRPDADAYWAAARYAASRESVRRGIRVAASAQSGDEPSVVVRASLEDAVAEQHADVVSVRTEEGSDLWDPLPVTLPTYVGKPAAHRTIRTIELGEPGAYSAGLLDSDEAAALADHSDGSVPDAHLEAGSNAESAAVPDADSGEPRRAVGS